MPDDDSSGIMGAAGAPLAEEEAAAVELDNLPQDLRIEIAQAAAEAARLAKEEPALFFEHPLHLVPSRSEPGKFSWLNVKTLERFKPPTTEVRAACQAAEKGLERFLVVEHSRPRGWAFNAHEAKAALKKARLCGLGDTPNAREVQRMSEENDTFLKRNDWAGGGRRGGKKSRRKRTKKSRTTGGKKSRRRLRKRTTIKGVKRKRPHTLT